MKFWKATEFRTFLHYVSIIVNRDFLWEEAFSHYLLYFCSMTIFSSNHHKPLRPFAKKLMYIYVKNFAIFMVELI